LTPEQRERIERILKEGQERTRQIWETVAPDMRKELQLVRERIKVELTPEQRRRFEELMKRPLRPVVRPDGTAPPDRLRQGSPGSPDPGLAPRQPRREPLPPVEPDPVEPR
jgi:DNA-binding MarR family transcriptional regulator